MRKFRKKPVVIEAIEWTGDNVHDVMTFANAHQLQSNAFISAPRVLNINTLEGLMTASVGDWIIKGVNGEFYPCKPDIFAKTYDAAE